MADYIADSAAASRPSVTVTGAGQATVNQGKFTLTAALGIGDTVSLCKLPAGHVPVDLIIDSDSVGSFDAGVIGVDPNAFIGAQASGNIARMDEIAGRRLAPADVDQTVGLTMTAGGGSVGNVINCTLISRAAGSGD